MTVLLVNPMNDFHANFFAFKLKKRGIPFIELGAFDRNDYTYENGKLIYNGKIVENITSIYVRGNLMYHPPKLNIPFIDTYNEQVRFRSQVEMLQSWIRIEEEQGARTLNSFVNNSKHIQLHKFMKAGLPIPKTCITNSLKQAEKFLEGEGNVVFKPLSGGYYCEKFTKEKMLETQSLNGEPVIFQEYIKGEDVRVYILNGEILSAHKIEKNVTDSIDYRTDSMFSEGKTTYTLFELPNNIKKICAEAANLSGLIFSGIDLKLTEDGKFYLLECNSMPQYLDVEFKNGVKITDKLIDYLYSDEENPVTGINIEAVLPGNSNQESETIFNYKEIYEKHYNEMKERANTVILPLNKDQVDEYKDVIFTPEDPFVCVTVKEVD